MTTKTATTPNALFVPSPTTKENERPTHGAKAKNKPYLKMLLVVLAWLIVVLPLTWGVYEAIRTSAPLVKMLIVSQHSKE